MYCIKMTQEFGRGLYASRKIYANEIIEVAEILVFVSIQDIEAGEQRFTDYNRDTQVETTEYVNKNMVG